MMRVLFFLLLIAFCILCQACNKLSFYMMCCRNPTNSITFAPVFSFMLHLTAASEKVVSKKLLSVLSSRIRLGFLWIQQKC